MGHPRESLYIAHRRQAGSPPPVAYSRTGDVLSDLGSWLLEYLPEIPWIGERLARGFTRLGAVLAGKDPGMLWMAPAASRAKACGFGAAVVLALVIAGHAAKYFGLLSFTGLTHGELALGYGLLLAGLAVVS